MLKPLKAGVNNVWKLRKLNNRIHVLLSNAVLPGV